MTIARGPLRVVGDVHGAARGFAAAAASDRFVVPLGDLTDYGPDSAEALRIMFRLIDEGRGLFVLGQRIVGWVMARIYDGAAFLQPMPNPARRAGSSGARQCSSNGGFHPAMLEEAPPPVPLTRPDAILSRALYGEPTGRTQPDGFPERSLRRVDKIPAGFTVYCGHDRRSGDGRPYVHRGAGGGVAVFLDTGAGKGGHLSWIDLEKG